MPARGIAWLVLRAGPVMWRSRAPVWMSGVGLRLGSHLSVWPATRMINHDALSGAGELDGSGLGGGDARLVEVLEPGVTESWGMMPKVLIRSQWHQTVWGGNQWVRNWRVPWYWLCLTAAFSISLSEAIRITITSSTSTTRGLQLFKFGSPVVSRQHHDLPRVTGHTFIPVVRQYHHDLEGGSLGKRGRDSEGVREGGVTYPG
eukprot:779499-Rhodomonas_salina.1